MERKVFDRDAVDAVKKAIGKVVDPALPGKRKVAIQPGSENGLRRGNLKAKTPPARKRKRTPFL